MTADNVSGKRRVFVGRHPDTNEPYFKTVKNVVSDPSECPEYPPIEGLLTAEELTLQRASREFERYNHPTKGSETSSTED